MEKLELTMTRDTPLIIVEAWYAGHIMAWQQFKYHFDQMIFVFNGTNIKSYRSSNIFHHKIPVLVSNWLKNNLDNQTKLFNEFSTYLKCNHAMHIVKKRQKKEITIKQAFLKIVKIYQLVVSGSPGLIPMFWIPNWQREHYQKTGKLLFPQKISDQATKTRYSANDALLDDGAENVDYYLRMIAEKKNWPFDLLRLTRLKELEIAIMSNQSPDFTELKKRSSGFGYFNNKIIAKKDLSKTLAKYKYQLNEEKPTLKNSFKGITANAGKVRGKVNTIMARSEINKFNVGDVLVAPMTTPWYVPLMKKAVAIITDEGGLACHAAIIARELKKPCIIGTKIATKVLEDGDLVEVDANKGIVRIIKAVE